MSAHELPLQLHWILPSQAGDAVAASLAGHVGADDLLTLHGADTLLHGRHQALHTQVLNTVGPCKESSGAHTAVQNRQDKTNTVAIALTDVSGNVLKLWLVGNEFLLGRYVNAHVTGEFYGWRGNPDVDLSERAA